MKYFISTGEVSGDIAGAALAREIILRDPAAELFGAGGDHLEEAGVRVEFRTTHLGIVGVAEAVRIVPSALRTLRAMRKRLLEERPQAAILIGNDLFHVVLGRWLRAQGIFTVSYFPPQVWIWRSLARWFAPSFDLILTSFPEEQEVWGRLSRTSLFVGHYLCDMLEPPSPEVRDAARRGLKDGRVIGLFPGSRAHEIESLAPIMLEAARSLLDRDPKLQFVLPVPDARHRVTVERAIAHQRLEGQVQIVDASHEAMRAIDVIILASGTASLEATLIGVPMLIVYRVNAMTLAIVRLCIRLGLMRGETVGLPNLILGREVVPELRQKAVTADAITRETWTLLTDHSARATQQSGFAEVVRVLRRKNTSARAAELIVTTCGHLASRTSLDLREHIPVAVAVPPLDRPAAESR